MLSQDVQFDPKVKLSFVVLGEKALKNFAGFAEFLDSASYMNEPRDSAARYRGESGRAYHEKKRSIPPAALPWVARSRAQKLQPYIAPNDIVFEYGAGYGWNLAALKCGRKLGFDIAETTHASLHALAIEVFKAPGLLPAGSVDVVICHHTLEHVINPPAALAEMRRLLKPQGKLLLFVPYEKEKRYQRYNDSELNHHLYSWNVQTLGNLVQDCGFKLVEARLGKFRFDRFAAHRAVQTGTGEAGFRFIRALALSVQPEYEVVIIASSEQG